MTRRRVFRIVAVLLPLAIAVAGVVNARATHAAPPPSTATTDLEWTHRVRSVAVVILPRGEQATRVGRLAGEILTLTLLREEALAVMEPREATNMLAFLDIKVPKNLTDKSINDIGRILRVDSVLSLAVDDVDVAGEVAQQTAKVALEIWDVETKKKVWDRALSVESEDLFYPPKGQLARFLEEELAGAVVALKGAMAQRKAPQGRQPWEERRTVIPPATLAGIRTIAIIPAESASEAEREALHVSGDLLADAFESTGVFDKIMDPHDSLGMLKALLMDVPHYFDPAFARYLGLTLKVDAVCALSIRRGMVHRPGEKPSPPVIRAEVYSSATGQIAWSHDVFPGTRAGEGGALFFASIRRISDDLAQNLGPTPGGASQLQLAAAGTHDTQVNLPLKGGQTGDGQAKVELTKATSVPAAATSTVVAANAATASVIATVLVKGVVFEDKDGDGKRGPKEPTFDGTVLALNDKTNKTNAKGEFELKDVALTGETQLRMIDAPPGYVLASPAAVRITPKPGMTELALHVPVRPTRSAKLGQRLMVELPDGKLATGQQVSLVTVPLLAFAVGLPLTPKDQRDLQALVDKALDSKNNLVVLWGYSNQGGNEKAMARQANLAVATMKRFLEKQKSFPPDRVLTEVFKPKSKKEAGRIEVRLFAIRGVF